VCPLGEDRKFLRILGIEGDGETVLRACHRQSVQQMTLVVYTPS